MRKCVEQNQCRQENECEDEENDEKHAQNTSIFAESSAESKEGDADENDGPDDEPRECVLHVSRQICLHGFVADFGKPIFLEDFFALDDAPKTEADGRQPDQQKHEVVEDENQLHKLRPTALQQRHLN